MCWSVNLMATFKTSYPKIQTFIDRTLEQCRAKGYVEVALMVYIFDKATTPNLVNLLIFIFHFRHSPGDGDTCLT